MTENPLTPVLRSYINAMMVIQFLGFNYDREHCELIDQKEAVNRALEKSGTSHPWFSGMRSSTLNGRRIKEGVTEEVRFQSIMSAGGQILAVLRENYHRYNNLLLCEAFEVTERYLRDVAKKLGELDAVTIPTDTGKLASLRKEFHKWCSGGSCNSESVLDFINWLCRNNSKRLLDLLFDQFKQFKIRCEIVEGDLDLHGTFTCVSHMRHIIIHNGGLVTSYRHWNKLSEGAMSLIGTFTQLNVNDEKSILLSFYQCRYLLERLASFCYALYTAASEQLQLPLDYKPHVYS